MKTKRIMSILLALALLLGTLNASVVSSEEKPPETEKPEWEPKVYANANIKEDFCGRFILLVMDKRIGGINKKHCQSFFGDIPIKNIIDLTEYPEKQLTELNAALEKGEDGVTIVILR